MNAIEISHLNRSYPGFSLKDVNLTLPCGAIMGLVGENGAGKSTTIKLIMNVIRRDSGSINVLGVDNTDARFTEIKEDIGIVLDEAYFPEVLSAVQVGKIMSYTYRRWDDECYRRYLDRFSLPEKKAFRDYSRGMKMKLAIAVALSHAPRLLILDEATSGLDPIVRDEILDIFNDFTRDASHSVLLSSHIISDLEKICDYVAFVHNGRLIFCDEKDHLLEKYALVRLSHSDFAAIPHEAVCGVKETGYAVESLVLRSGISDSVQTEHLSLEDVILFLTKGEKK